MSILYLSLQDFLSKPFLKFSLLPFLISLFLFILLVYYSYDIFFSYIEDVVSGSFMAWFFSFSIVQFSLAFLSAIGGFFIVVFASVFFTMLIISFLTPYIVKKINQKYYNYSIQKEVNSLEVLLKTFKFILISCVLFVVATFLLIIPFVSIVIYYGVFYYLFHKLLLLDVLSNVLDKNNFDDFYKNSSPLYFKIITLIFFALSSIPLLGLFLQVFYVIFLSHLCYQKILKIKAKNNG
ncbi:EI24 domain-containing protein [Campylobacter sp. FU_520]|uniref:EI24 domain-containing protein n=1 Tax=Campylobacter sp. FU_520 TaxID=2911611 RepID=UPI0021E65629|nr:EI24 domain-containing protein [Campylobacter sp. FU_520]MCV3453485.1 EI24 domain-containing protein [Campylobacter sp. FU_520]